MNLKSQLKSKANILSKNAQNVLLDISACGTPDTTCTMHNTCLPGAKNLSRYALRETLVYHFLTQSEEFFLVQPVYQHDQGIESFSQLAATMNDSFEHVD